MRKVIFEAFNVRKEIDGIQVLQNISFKLVDQTVTAIVGKNGSGKSTLLKTLAGIYEPTSGKIIRNTRKIGYVPEHFPENLRFKLKEYLLLMASFNGFSTSHIEKEISEYASLFGIETFLNQPLKQCSKGTKHKAGIIQSLLLKPEILLLDEPLTGLDTTSQNQLISHLEKIKKKVSIIFTTHEEDMIARLANQIIYLESGKFSLSNTTGKSKKIIKVKFPSKNVFQGLDLFAIHYEQNNAFLTVDSNNSDQILITLLNKKCSVLEVKEMR